MTVTEDAEGTELDGSEDNVLGAQREGIADFEIIKFYSDKLQFLWDKYLVLCYSIAADSSTGDSQQFVPW